MIYDYDLIVIGAGGGGLTAAIGGASIGAKVLLVEGEKLGGDCTHYGCVPSKALIRAAHIVHANKDRSSVGLSDRDHGSINEAHDVLRHVKKIVADVESRFEDPEEIKRKGVDIEMGYAKFVDSHRISVNDQTISSKKFVIATGARPANLPIEGLEDVVAKSNRDIFEPDSFDSLIIIGSGPIGCELGQAFARLGVDVQIITRDDRVLSRDEKEASQIVGKSLKEDGVRVYYSRDINRVFLRDGKKAVTVTDQKSRKSQEVCADEILVAIGRQPNVENLDLEKAGVLYDIRKGISVNEKTQTNVSHIYAVGDVATKWKFTHYANHMSKVALANLIFHYPTKISKVIPRVTFCSPEVASIGVSTQDIADKQSLYHVFDKAYSDVDRAITDVNENGFFRIITDTKGMIHGATIVGGSAGEMINEIALAMQNGVSITQLSDTIHAYPTYGYGLRNCADQYRALSYTDSKKSWVKKIFGLRGR